MRQINGRGYIILLTGISGSGKTTLGKALYDVLKKGGRKVEFIDGDMVRKFLEIGGAYAREERFMITKEIAYAAHLLAKHGMDVIVANIAGSIAARDFLRRKWRNYIQIFLDVDVNDCIKNDRKGVYKKALNSKSPFCYGIDIAYERPRNPDAIVHPYKETTKQSLDIILACLERRGFSI